MSPRVGAIGQSTLTFPSAALGSAAGRTIALNNQSLALVDAVSILYTASATVGNRQVFFQLKDGAGNILWQCAATAAITAGQTPRLVAGAGVTPVSTTSPLMQTMQLPSELAVPPGSTFVVADAANIDTADTVAGNVSLAF
jgi:hypothetical protein